MRRKRSKSIAVIVLLLMLVSTFAGCTGAKQAIRSKETDALFAAVRAGSADSVRSLLTSPDVDVNGVDDNGNTPLIEAARLGHNEVVASLLAAKADVNAKDKQGKTALMLAAEGGHEESVQLLKLRSQNYAWTKTNGTCHHNQYSDRMRDCYGLLQS